MRTNRQFSWTASTPQAWSWPTLTAAPTPTVEPPIVVGQTVWIITDDGEVKKGRVLSEVPSAPAARPRASSPSSGK